ncbi:hypothetical protein KUCAC02_035651, partial [Chaenocephalus aceratus]
WRLSVLLLCVTAVTLVYSFRSGMFFRWLCVVLVFSTKGQRYLRVGLAVPLFGSVATLRRMVADEGQISPDQGNEKQEERLKFTPTSSYF